MTDQELRLLLKNLFEASPQKKREFETTGINPDNAPPWLIFGGLVALTKEEDVRRQHERDDIIRKEDYEVQTRIEKAKAEALRYSMNEAAKIIRDGNKEDSQRLEQILTSIQDGCKKMLQSGSGSTQLAEGKAQEKYIAALISYMNCWRKHPKSEEYPQGRPGPSQCISTMPQEEGIHYRCLVAFASQSEDGFARLPYQIFHAELLRQGDCPRPLSRSITRRIPGISWLLTRPDICPLADGGEYVLKKGGNLERVSD